jgi:hypothetical protein
MYVWYYYSQHELHRLNRGYSQSHNSYDIDTFAIDIIDYAIDITIIIIRH